MVIVCVLRSIFAVERFKQTIQSIIQVVLLRMPNARDFDLMRFLEINVQVDQMETALWNQISFVIMDATITTLNAVVCITRASNQSSRLKVSHISAGLC